MHAVSLLAVAFQEQVPFTPAAGDASDGRMWLWIALIVGRWRYSPPLLWPEL